MTSRGKILFLSAISLSIVFTGFLISSFPLICLGVVIMTYPYTKIVEELSKDKK